MYVITVEFTIHPEHLAAFMPLMLENARISRETEPGCRRFDVCRDPAHPQHVFLYELYDDRAAFDAHLAAAHFKAFDAAVKAMVASKAVHATNWQVPEARQTLQFRLPVPMPDAMKAPVSRASTPPRKPAKTTIAKKPAVAVRPGRRPAKEPFADKAYRELRARILDNSMPSGEQYTEEELAAMLQMSRTPTREAMLRLAGEGLVEVRPRHGMRIKPVSQVDMREIYEVLTALESTAAALAAARSDQGGSVALLRASIRDMDAALERDDLAAWAAADERFHTLLVEAAGNSRLTELVQTYVGQSHRVRMLTLRLRPKPVMSNRDHEAVVDAVAAHDARRARELHFAHREQSGRMLVELLASHGLTRL